DQKDLNKKFLRGLPSEWATYVAIWKEKETLDKTNLDDIYNNLKVHESDVKKSNTSSSDPENLAFLSHTSNSKYEVSTAQAVNTAGGV
ncbi:hypothetical protein, partial [Bacillus cereus group sp. BC58]|uniref:hypothetical protein n=1 Tax=Bacillus cereus group sp. BC58 TaxID=3445286 RepID=UPI003F21D61C